VKIFIHHIGLLVEEVQPVYSGHRVSHWGPWSLWGKWTNLYLVALGR